MSQPQPFIVPGTDVKLPDLSESINIPNNIVGQGDVPDWVYKKFEITDVFHSKIGIAAATSIISFSILMYLNPPFCQENGDNAIRSRKPCFPKLYMISLFVFILVLIIPVNPVPPKLN